ncbi:MAG TPA: hypothetical protein VEB86_15425 [Chryseosolibacter sp.]|nr:hypothetical protein [Chryseosolibacter sp.]
METNLIELRRQNGRRGGKIPFLSYLKLSDFIVSSLNGKEHITVFELIDRATTAFKDEAMMKRVLDVREDLVAKKILSMKVLPGRNQLLGLSRDFQQNRTVMVTLADQHSSGVYVTF